MAGVAERAAELVALRVPFVHARVVLAERPTSAHPGDEALILPDGTMEGFVGGECAESTVRAQSLAVLDTGEPVLLRISPAPEAPVPGRVMAHNPCLSGGTLEIFLEPRRPPPRVAVVGDGPIAAALRTVGAALGYEVVDSGHTDGAAAVVVASHGRAEVETLTAALAAGIDYVGLVASPKRGAVVVGELDAEGGERIVTPAGLDIGARTPEEVALSIFADVIARRPRPSARPAAETPDGATATTRSTDPVCGMDVAAADSSLHLDHDGRRHWFCGSGCLRAFAAEPARYAG